MTKRKVISAQLYIYLGTCITSGQKMKVLLLAQHSSAVTFHQRGVISGWDENERRKKKIICFLGWHREGFNTFFSFKTKTEQLHGSFATVGIRSLFQWELQIMRVNFREKSIPDSVPVTAEGKSSYFNKQRNKTPVLKYLPRSQHSHWSHYSEWHKIFLSIALHCSSM